MAVASLRYRPNAQNPEENKLGHIIYNGSAVDFHHWKFRTELKIACAKDDAEYQKVAQNVVETLRGDPLQAAIEIGIPTLTSKTAKGVEQLIGRVQGEVFPLKDEEAKALYREGHKIGGVLSRQAGEGMTSFISRRERWYKLLTSMDDTIKMSDEMLGDMLLDNAGLTETQKLLILTSVNNSKKFEKIAEALKKQHSKIQFGQQRAPMASGHGGKGKGGKGKGHGYKKPWKPSAHAAVAGEDDYEEYCVGDYDEEMYEEPAPYAEEPWVEQDHTDHYDGCVDQQDHHGEEIDDEILALELRTVADLDAEAPHDIGDEIVSDVVQSQTIACMAWFTTGQSKGKKKGKGKGKGKRFPIGESNMSLEERKRKLAALKARTSCSACGEKGHWAGDAKCHKNNGSGAGKGSGSKPKPGGYVAIIGDADSNDTSSGALTIVEGKPEEQSDDGSQYSADEEKPGAYTSKSDEFVVISSKDSVLEDPEDFESAASSSAAAGPAAGPAALGARPKPKAKQKPFAWEAEAGTIFKYGPYKGQTYKHVADTKTPGDMRWIKTICETKNESQLPKYQQDYKK